MVQRENESKLISGIKQMKEKERKEGAKNNNFDNVKEKMKQLENTINEGFEKVLEINPVKVTQEQVQNSFADTVKMSNKVIIPEFRKMLLDEKIKEFGRGTAKRLAHDECNHIRPQRKR